MTAGAATIARAARLMFWDFDGVIKESVDVKTRAFMRLFEPYGVEIVALVRAHHEDNGGMSRFEKMPLYLRFAGIEPEDGRVAALCDEFHRLVRDEVIAAPWVRGAEEWLRSNAYAQRFVLVSATPQGELDDIVAALQLRSCFAAIFGAPTSKTEAVQRSLRHYGVAAGEAVLIGDAVADRDAAEAAGVPFILRQHSSNGTVVAGPGGMSVRDLTEL